LKLRTGVLAAVLLGLGLFFSGASGFAQAQENEGEAAMKLEEIVVTATKTKKLMSDVPADVEVVTADEIKRRNSFGADEVMSDMAGVYMKKANFADFTSSTTMSIRGIEGGERTLILYNGIPINEPYFGMGHVEFGAISMDEVEQVEVVKGPFSALYGGNAMAGVINVITRVPDESEIVLKTNYSSFDTMHNFIKLSKRWNDKWGISGSFDKLTSDGQQNSYITARVSETADITGMTKVTGVQSSSTTTGSTQYFVGDPGEQSWDQDKFGLTLNFTPSPNHDFILQTVYSDRTIDHNNAQNYLRDENGNIFDDGTFYYEKNGAYYTGTVTPETFLYRMRWTPRVEKNILSALTYNGLFGQTNVTTQMGYVTHDLQRIKSRRTGATEAGGPAQSNEIDDYSAYFDTHATHPFGAHELTFGISARHNDANETVNELTDWKDFDSVTVTTSDITGDNTLYSAYAQGDIKLLEKLELFVGGRYDFWDNSGGQTIVRSRDGSQEEIITFDATSQGKFSPKLALLSRLTPDTTLRSSWGMAFRPPSLSEMYRSSINFGSYVYYSNPDLKPETSQSFDLGITQKLFGGRTVISSAVFYNRIKDMITSTTMNYLENGLEVRKNVNVGECESMGIELSVTQRIFPWLSFSGNYTYTTSEVLENDIDPSIVGNELATIPKNMFNLSLDAEYKKLWARLNFEYADEVWSTTSNTETVWGVYGAYDKIELLNFKIGYKINDHADISYGCNNILDKEYYAGTGTGLADSRRHLVEVKVRF